MKKKILLITLMVALFVCVFMISANATSLSNFVDVKLTLVDGTEVTAYMSGGVSWSGYQGYDRRNLYKSYEDTSETYEWIDVEVFDMRESQIYTYDSTNGKVATDTYPVTLLQHPSDPNNVTHVYYPQGSVIVADSSFASSYGWTSLEYLWIPKSVEIIGQNVCKEASTLKNVEIEDGSQLKEVRKEAFMGCSSLNSFDFPETVTTIGYCAFYQAGLSGKMVLPNAVTSIGDGAFRTTKIETLVFGDGAVEIGYNIVGNKDSDNTYLKEVYVPITATFNSSHLSEIWFATKDSTINFYVIADYGVDCSEFITTLKGTGRVKFATQAEIEAGTAQSGYNAVIIEGYNKCKAFYNDVHQGDDGDCTTADTCTRCKETFKANKEHNITVNTLVYANGLGSTGIRNYICDNSGCYAADEINKEYDPIISAKGYSFKESDKTGLDGGYSINAKLLALYEELNGSAKIGIIIVNASDAQKNGLVDESFKLISKMGVQVELTSREYSYFDLRITGFNTEELQKLGLIITSYVVDDFDGDGAEEIKYIQHKMSDANESPVTIGGLVYNTVTVERAYKEKYPDVA